jgi:diacylglycerol kinase family enzyme
VRALLIVNPHATSTTRERRDVIARALASVVDLEVVQTRYRGEATKLAAAAASEKFGLVMTLGGDGTVNEAVNGLLGGAHGTGAADGKDDEAGRWMAVLAGGDGARPDGARPDGARPDAAELPALAALPGGNANVFTRSLRLPTDPVDATGRLIEDLASGKERCIGLGTANGRYFTFNAGVGLDAEVVRAVEGRRAHGQLLTPTLFARTALRQYYQVTNRRHPAISIAEPSGLCADAVYICMVSNSAPWTYLGHRPVNTNPQAGFDTGLDLLALRSLSTLTTMSTLRQMLAERTDPPAGRTVVSGHDLGTIDLHASRPVAFQVDGEYMGEVEEVKFRSVPSALRVIGLAGR